MSISQKSDDKVYINYVQDVISAFYLRMRSAEKHDDQLIIDEHS